MEVVRAVTNPSRSGALINGRVGNRTSQTGNNFWRYDWLRQSGSGILPSPTGTSPIGSRIRKIFSVVAGVCSTSALPFSSLHATKHGTKRSHSASSVKGSSVMPLYFFHLNFGQRVVPDEEGVELLSRSAARDEALAVVRELVNAEAAGSRRRWAGWFVEVADEIGGFFRTPIGQPALEIVTPAY